MPMLVLKGFQNDMEYFNPEYDSYTDSGFSNFGTIRWMPKIATDSNGEYRIAIPNFGQKSVKVLINGISSDGKMISNTSILQTP